MRQLLVAGRHRFESGVAAQMLDGAQLRNTTAEHVDGRTPHTQELGFLWMIDDFEALLTEASARLKAALSSAVAISR